MRAHRGVGQHRDEASADLKQREVGHAGALRFRLRRSQTWIDGLPVSLDDPLVNKTISKEHDDRGNKAAQH